MKTSNKILLALFLLPFVVCLFIYVSLYAKYKNNDFITEKQLNEENHITEQLPSFSQIAITHFKGDITIEQSNDRSVRFEKWNKENFVYEVKNNVLNIRTIKGDYASLTILCPSFEQLNADSAGVQINSMKFQNLRLNLGHEANVHFKGQADSLTAAIKSSSGLDLNSEATAGVLNLILDNHASFESVGQIKQFGNIQLQDSADVRMNGKAMRALLDKAAITE
ncbi:MAG: GIN domain-containing protein [Agriterribacter sp.]